MADVVQFRSKRQLVRSRKRAEALNVLWPHVLKIVGAGERTKISGRPCLLNRQAGFAVLAAKTQDGLYLRIDQQGQHVFTAYEKPDGGAVSVATWKRGEWEAEILDAFPSAA
jgi:hypothetical protein